MTRKSCFRCGCLGCLGLIGLAVLVSLILLVVGVITAPGEPAYEDLRLEHPVADLSGLAEDRGRDGRIALGAAPSPPPGVGRIVLDVSRLQFTVVPGPPGSAIRVEGRYDTAAYALEEWFDRGDGDGDGGDAWSYHLTVEPRGLDFVMGDDDFDRLRLVIPRDVPFRLSGSLGIGETALELGGLDVRAVDLSTGIGQHTLGFAEPTPLPLELLSMSGSIGVLRLDGVGNASPRRVSVSHRLGEVAVGLDGAWRGGADVTVRTGLGESRVVVPDDVRLDIESASLTLGEMRLPEPEEDPRGPAPPATIRLRVRHGLGELSVSR